MNTPIRSSQRIYYRRVEPDVLIFGIRFAQTGTLGGLRIADSTWRRFAHRYTAVGHQRKHAHSERATVESSTNHDALFDSRCHPWWRLGVVSVVVSRALIRRAVIRQCGEWPTVEVATDDAEYQIEILTGGRGVALALIDALAIPASRP